MSLIKRLIPNDIKQQGKYLLLDILKIPYSRFGVDLEIIKWLPKNKPITFFDIGANVGHFSTALCGEYKIEKGILIEPVAQLIPVLEKNFPDRDTFKILNVAVSNINAEVDFYTNNEFDAISSLLKINSETDELKSLNIKSPVLSKILAFTLDHIYNDQHLNRVDLLKIDVQGAEHLVLQGATETLKNTKIVYTEFSYKPLYHQSSLFIDLYNIMYTNGFFLASVSPGHTSPQGELLQGDAIFINKNFVD